MDEVRVSESCLSSSKQQYASSGVDIVKADHLIAELKSDHSPTKPFKHGLGHVTSGIGGFAGAFATNFSGLQKPTLVACTDGVGTKLTLAAEAKDYSGIGQDLVAMCLNDLYTLGATPLFFLDYFACSGLDTQQFKVVLQGIKSALLECETSLLGGETAELPGMFKPGDFDIAGFVVGVVDQVRSLSQDLLQPGDLLVGWQSSGFHSNGYSLLRQWLKQLDGQAHTNYRSKLLTPTKIYRPFLDLHARLDDGMVRCASHITGGGISDNLARVIPSHLSARVHKKCIKGPAWMGEFADKVGRDLLDYLDVLNGGIGWITAIDPSVESVWLRMSEEQGLAPVVLGEVVQRSGESAVEYI